MTKNYTMEQLNAFLYDALNEEDLSAHQIYETIIETVAEHTEYLQIQYEKSQQLFDLLKGTVKPYKSPWNQFIQTIQIGNVFNRMFIFPGDTFHSGDGFFGNSKETSRLTIVTFVH